MNIGQILESGYKPAYFKKTRIVDYKVSSFLSKPPYLLVKNTSFLDFIQEVPTNQGGFISRRMVFQRKSYQLIRRRRQHVEGLVGV